MFQGRNLWNSIAQNGALLTVGSDIHVPAGVNLARRGQNGLKGSVFGGRWRGLRHPDVNLKTHL